MRFVLGADGAVVLGGRDHHRTHRLVQHMVADRQALLQGQAVMIHLLDLLLQRVVETRRPPGAQRAGESNRH